MSFVVKATSGSGGGGVKAPPGNHLAVLVGVFDMGTQSHEYQGKQSWRRDVYLCWELVGQKVAGANKNHLIGAAVTMSLNEKATLRKWVEARTGKRIANDAEFDVTSELGQPCLLNVVLSQSGYPRVEGVAGLPAGLPVPTPSYKPVAVSLEEFKAGTEIPEWVPWHFGNPLSDHVRACKEIGGPKPERNGGSGQPAGGNGGGEYQAPAGGPIPF